METTIRQKVSLDDLLHQTRRIQDMFEKEFYPSELDVSVAFALIICGVSLANVLGVRRESTREFADRVLNGKYPEDNEDNEDKIH